MVSRTCGFSLLLAASLIWGTSLVAQNMGMRHMEPFTFNAARFLMGAAVLSVVSRFLRSQRGKKTAAAASSQTGEESRNICFAGGLTGGVLFLAVSLQQVGILYTSVSKAGFITALYIVIVPVLGLAYGNRSSRMLWFCVALATAGVYLLCIPESWDINRGDALIFACAVLSAWYILLIDRYAQSVDEVWFVCVQFLVCGLLSGCVALLAERPDWSGLLAGWGPIAYTGFFSCAIAYTFQIVGQKAIQPVVASLVLSLEAVFAAWAARVLLEESLSSQELIGCAFLCVAIVFAQGPEVMSALVPKSQTRRIAERQGADSGCGGSNG